MNMYIIEFRVDEEHTETRTVEAKRFQMEGGYVTFRGKDGSIVAVAQSPYLVKQYVEES